MVHLCEVCGKDMGDCSPSRKYCSPACERKARKKRNSLLRMMRVTPRICPQCGKEFTPNRNEKYCSKECLMEHRREDSRNYYYQNKLSSNKPESTGVCKHCGKEFIKTSPGQIYCTKECRLLDVSERDKKLREERDARAPLLVCPVCGKKFPRKGSKIYCSSRCREKANSHKYEKLCAMCGKEFYPIGHQKYCSEECRVRAKLVKKKRGMTRLAYEAAEATAHGMSYGKYKAMKAG